MISEQIIRELKSKYVEYEHWLLSGFSVPKPKKLPAEYLKLFSQKPEAYNIYRQAMFKFIQQLSGKYEILNDLEKLVTLLIQNNRSGYDQIIDSFNSRDLVSKFREEWSNAFETSKLVKKNEISHEICYFYQSKYEIDELLFCLAVIRKLLTDNVVDLSLSNLKDKRGAIKKGVMVDYISAGLRDYPNLKHAVDKAYIPKLRNTIGHNNYSIKNGLLKSLDGTIIVNKKEFFESLCNIQELHNAIIWILANIDYDKIIHATCDCGVISIAFKVVEPTQLPGIDLYQLWCFYEGDAQKNWLRNATFSISEKELITTFTSNALFKGPIIPELDKWLNYARKCSNVLVEIHSVIPFIGDDNVKIELGWGTYQVTKNSLTKSIPVQITAEK